MRDEIIKRNLIINISSLLVFFLFSIVITSFFNKKTLEENVIKTSSIFESKIKEASSDTEIREMVDSFVMNDTWIDVIVAKMDGTIIVSSSDDSLGLETQAKLSQKEIELITSYRQEKERILIDDDYIYYILNVDDTYILKVGQIYEVSTQYILLSIFVMLSLLILVIFITLMLTNNTSKKFLDTFSLISLHLKTVNEGHYEEMEIKNSYIELEPILNEINEVNNNISRSFEQIKNEIDKMNFIINNVTQGMIIIDEFKDILIINETAKMVLNIDKNISKSREYDKYIQDDKINSLIQKALDNKGSYSMDFPVDSTRRIYSINLNYLKNKWNEQNKEIGLLFILINDVTEDRMNDKLKRDFISNASHELKTPITSIRGFSELLSNFSNDEKTKKYSEIILNESIKMKDTIDNLLYLSSLDGDKELAKEQIFFNDIVSEVIEELKVKADSKNISITSQVQDLYVITDYSLLYHLIINLVENAIKYNKENGSISIVIEDIGDTIAMSIKDTGIGIEEKNLSRIYDRFFRVDKSRSRETGGTGIGLNIVKEICDKIDAKIEVESEINVGTKFTVYFNKGE